jgi:hypothetical protein
MAKDHSEMDIARSECTRKTYHRMVVISIWIQVTVNLWHVCD